MEFLRETLDNGLEIVAEHNANAYSTALGYFVRTGARDESDELSGVSHFLEHMLFKGTPRRSAADVNRELDELGAEANAYTNEEQTVYYARVLPEYQHAIVDLLTDLMRPSLREADFAMEKNVILEEIAKYEDQPPFGANEKVMAAHFRDHPLGRSVLGTTESVTDLTVDQMKAYFEQRYSPGNLALVASGQVDFEALVAQAKELCGPWKPYEVSRDTPPGRRGQGFHVLHKSIATQEYGVLISDGPSSEDDRRYAAKMLSTVLGDGSGSRMYWDLVETGRVEYAEMSPYDFQGAGIMMTFVCCAPEDAEEVLARVRAIHEKAQSEGITADELEQAKNKICSHVVLRSERPASRLFDVGSNWIQTRHYRPVRELIELVRNLTVDDLHQVLEDFPITDTTTMLVGPRDTIQPPPGL